MACAGKPPLALDLIHKLMRAGQNRRGLVVLPNSKAPVRELWMHCLRADQPDRRQGGIRAPAHSTIAESWFGQPSREIAHKRAIALPPAALRAVC